MSGRSVREYLRRTSSFVNRPRRLFGLLHALLMQCQKMVSRSCFKKLFFISVPVRKMLLPLELIVSVALRLHPHFFKHWSISSVFEAASWKSNTVFTSLF